MSAAKRTFELIWQQDPSAYAFVRASDGTLSADGLTIGTPASAELGQASEIDARRVGVRDLVALAARPPAGLEPGGSALGVFALVDLAHRSVAEGLVHPYLDHGDGGWHAFWGATLDATVRASLAEIAAALPPVAADAFGGDREATVHDLYPVIVDQVARDRLRADRVSFAGALPRRPAPLDLFVEGLAAPESLLPPHSGYGALKRRLSRWVYDGLGALARGSTAAWQLSVHLDERSHGDVTELALELWLQAEDDPTLSLPVSLVWEDGHDIFSFLRASDPRKDFIRQLGELEPLLARHGIEFDGAEATETKLDVDTAGVFLREAMPELEELGVPVLLPSAWLRAPKVRLNLTATSGSDPAVRSSGLLSASSLVHFDWRLAVGDASLTEDELLELAKAKDSFVRVAGRWHAVQRSEIERALRFLERHRSGTGLVDLVRAVSGLDTDEAGLELGAVALDASLAELLGDGDQRFRSLPTPASMAFQLFPFQERGHGWLRMLGDLGVGAILADDMGLGKTVQAIAMIASEREDHAVGPTLVVCPMSVVKQWVAEIERFAPALRVVSHHGVARLAGDALVGAALKADVVVTSYDIATRDIETLGLLEWDRLLLDEAQDIKNPATKRARALRLLRARRRVAMTGTPIENRLNELWAIMDIVNPGLLGPREGFDRRFARPIETTGDEEALERLRAIVQPFILRRAKDSPEVELELPPITIEKDYCRLTLEQASLYQATVDRWLPRIEAQQDSFGQRGSVLAMLSQLKRVCNHPELLLSTGQALDGRSGKLDRLVELLALVPSGDKALVFTQYPGFDRLVPYLAQQLDTDVGFFHGRLTARQRDDVLHAFEREDGPSVLVISIKAGGRGLNLPAANHVIHFDRWWNPAVEQQATDRVHRVGQLKPVFVHSLICLGTLEERIDQLLESKRELAAKVIHAGSEDWLGELDLGAIRAAVALSPDWMEAAA